MFQYLTEHEWAMITCKFVIIILLTGLISRIFGLLWHRSPQNNQSLFRKFVHNILRVLIYLLGILFALSQIPGLSNITQTLLAGSGILALAVSLSAQESLNNVISGLFITLFKPFEVGNRVTLVNNNITGTIEDITLRHTIIKTFTNTRVVIPNSTMNKEIIENSELIDSNASAFVDITVAYESDIDKAMEIMADVIGNHPSYLDVRTDEDKKVKPKVKVYVRNLGDSGIMLRANFWSRTVSENFDACSDVRLQLKKSFDAAGIEIPYTKYTILRQESKDHDLPAEIIHEQEKEQQDL